jgi:hypothetical protein
MGKSGRRRKENETLKKIKQALKIIQPGYFEKKYGIDTATFQEIILFLERTQDDFVTMSQTFNVDISLYRDVLDLRWALRYLKERLGDAIKIPTDDFIDSPDTFRDEFTLLNLYFCKKWGNRARVYYPDKKSLNMLLKEIRKKAPKKFQRKSERTKPDKRDIDIWKIINREKITDKTHPQDRGNFETRDLPLFVCKWIALPVHKLLYKEPPSIFDEAIEHMRKVIFMDSVEEVLKETLESSNALPSLAMIIERFRQKWAAFERGELENSKNEPAK